MDMRDEQESGEREHTALVAILCRFSFFCKEIELRKATPQALTG